MARFAVGQPITTTTPTIAVDAGLPVGQQRFQLVVIDQAGRRSVPATALVLVRQIIIDPGPVVGPLPGPILPDPVGPSPGPVIPIPVPQPGPGPVIRSTPVDTPREAAKPKRKPSRKEPK